MGALTIRSSPRSAHSQCPPSGLSPCCAWESDVIIFQLDQGGHTPIGHREICIDIVSFVSRLLLSSWRKNASVAGSQCSHTVILIIQLVENSVSSELNCSSSSFRLNAPDLMGDLTQEDFDGICELVSTQSGSSSSPAQLHVSTECWLQFLDGLTSDRPNNRSLLLANESFSSQEALVEMEVTSTWPPLSSCTVPQQLLPFITKYNFETCRSIYFEFCAELTPKGPNSPSKSQNGLSCHYFPDYKCKQSPYPVITTCRKVPSCSLCARCGSLGDHTMIHCLGCCEVYHYFCVHLPERLVPRLISWFCHRCAVCSVCTGKEVSGKRFAADIIETCFRCQDQFHVHCQRTNNFSIIHKDSSKQMKVCNKCLFRSSCKRCRSIISPDEVYKEWCEISSHVCVECRNSRERDLCRKCIFDLRSELRKFVCEDCRDVYHSDCLCDTEMNRLENGIAFLCSGCIPPSALTKKPDRWSLETGRAILKSLRAEIIRHMNGSLNRMDDTRRKSASDGSSSDELLDMPLSLSMDGLGEDFTSGDSSFVENIDQFVPAADVPAADVPAAEYLHQEFATSRPHQEPIPGDERRDSERDEGIGEEVGDGPVASAGNQLDREVSQPSPDSGVAIKSDHRVINLDSGRSPCSFGDSAEELLNNSSEKLKSLAWFYAKSNSKTPIMPILTFVTFASPTNFMDDPVFLLDKISAFQKNVAVTGIPKKNSSAGKKVGSFWTGWHSIMLRTIDGLSQDEDTCGDPKKLEKAVREMTRRNFSSAFRRNMEACFAQFCSRTVPVELQRKRGKFSRISIFPVLRRGSEAPPTVHFRSDGEEEAWPVRNSKKKFRIMDERLCFFCSVAGDDNANHAGRLLSVGHDLWAHIGCLSFASTKKRVFDYTVYKLSNLESPNFRRSECALCPVPLGVVGCAQKRCPNSYHMNCAVAENCLFSSCLLTGALGAVCPSHRQDNLADEHRVKAVRLIDLQRSFLEMPVFARSPPTNVQTLGNPAWSSGVPKEDIKIHLGSAFVEELGQLVRGWETKDMLMPCGYKMQRVFWSAVMPHQLTRYTFIILDMNAHPAIKAQICAVLQREDLPDWESLTQCRVDHLNSALPHSSEFPLEETLWLHHDEPIPAESQREGGSLLAEKTDDFIPPSIDNCPDLVLPRLTTETSTESQTNPLAQFSQEGKEAPRSAQSRSSSPEIPVRRQPVFANHPAKRPRSSSQSPMIEAKRLSIFPPGIDSVSRSDVPTGGRISSEDLPFNPSPTKDSDMETWCPLFSGPRRATRSSKNPSPSPEISELRRPPRSSNSLPVAPPPGDAMNDRSNFLRMRKVEVEVDGGERRPFVRPLHTVQESNTTRIDIEGSPDPAVQPQRKGDLSLIAVEDFAKDLQKAKRKKGRPPKHSAFSLDASPTLAPVTVFSPGSTAPSPEGPAKSVLFSPRKSARLVELQSCTQSQNVCEKPAIFHPHTLTGLRSCFKGSSGLGQRRIGVKRVRFSGRVEERFFQPSFYSLPSHYIADPAVAPDPGPYFPPRQDNDPNPRCFTEAKHRGHLEIAKTRKSRVNELLEMIRTSDISRLSKQPSQVCVLVGQDGFLAASHWPEDLVSHLFEDIQRNRRAGGVISVSPVGIPIGLTPGQFVGLTYPVVRHLLEQLPVPSNSIGVIFSPRRETTCWTCPLPPHCFTVLNGRTYIRVPVIERQVVFKWRVSYHVVSDLQDALPRWIRVFNSSFVDPVDFPEWYEDVRHDRSQTFVLSYALHSHENLVSFALIAKQNFDVGTEVKFDPQRKPHRVKDALGVTDFSCAKHGRVF